MCGNVGTSKCTKESGRRIPELYFTNVTGIFCTCTTDLCNGNSQTSAHQTTPPRSPFDSPTSGGGIVVSFHVTSLLALTAACFLNEWWWRPPIWIAMHCHALWLFCYFYNKTVVMSMLLFATFWSYNIYYKHVEIITVDRAIFNIYAWRNGVVSLLTVMFNS